MRMKFLILILLLLTSVPTEAAPMIDKHARVAVMDFEPHEGTSDYSFDLLNAEKASNDYVIERLFDNGYFQIVDKDLMHEKLGDLNTNGIIDAATAKKIGKILDVEYIIYGNVISIVAENSLTEAYLSVRIMDVSNGRILMASKGRGKSRSSSGVDLLIFRIGTMEATQQSVHNALQKATYQATDILIDRLFNQKHK